jgi:hypothetical protein
VGIFVGAMFADAISDKLLKRIEHVDSPGIEQVVSIPAIAEDRLGHPRSVDEPQVRLAGADTPGDDSLFFQPTHGALYRLSVSTHVFREHVVRYPCGVVPLGEHLVSRV